MHSTTHARAFDLVRLLAASTPKGQPLVGSGDLATFQKLLEWLNSAFGLSGYSPHSPRAGFASDGLLSGVDFVTLREEGRWLSDSSLRIYLDLVSTAVQSAQADTDRWLPLISLIDREFVRMYPWWQQSGRRPTCPLPPQVLDLLVEAWKRRPLQGKLRRRP